MAARQIRLRLTYRRSRVRALIKAAVFGGRNYAAGVSRLCAEPRRRARMGEAGLIERRENADLRDCSHVSVSRGDIEASIAAIPPARGFYCSPTRACGRLSAGKRASITGEVKTELNCRILYADAAVVSDVI